MASDKDVTMIVDLLTVRPKRLPTEEEVVDFIMGETKKKEEIWNGKPVPTDRV